MEILTDKRIRTFLRINIDYSSNIDANCGYGNGSGSGYDNGSGYGCGRGDGYGNGNGSGSGYDNDSGSGYGNGRGYGCGRGDGSGSGYGNGSGYGSGCDYSYGNGSGLYDGEGRGYSNGSGGGIKKINGYIVYKVDDLYTIFTSIHGNIAKGFIIEKNTKLIPCYIVKENNKFAHGETLHDAFASLQEKLYDGSTEEERIKAFKTKFPEYDTKYDNRDLFTYHHILTGSCRMGRESFIKSRGISLNGKTTVREFVELTKGAYGGNIIIKLAQEY